MSRRSLVLVLAACSAPALEPAPTPKATTAGAFVERTVATAPGLSGLALDDTGALWTVAERDERAYRIRLAPSGEPQVETFTIDGVSSDFDLEGIAWLGDDRFAFGTEGKQRGVATLLLARREGSRIAVTGTIELPAARVGIELPPNHGAEGVCGRGETIVVAIEGAGQNTQGRWAPIVRIERGVVVAAHALSLTTRTGKISALDCTLDERGVIHAWAIERHFEVTKILAFELPPDAADGSVIVPRVALDLGAALHGRLNLEGLARAPDGTMFAIVDNQWRTITGPSRLLVFPPGAAP